MILRVMGRCLVYEVSSRERKGVSVDVLAWVRGGNWSKVLG